MIRKSIHVSEGQIFTLEEWTFKIEKIYFGFDGYRCACRSLDGRSTFNIDVDELQDFLYSGLADR